MHRSHARRSISITVSHRSHTDEHRSHTDHYRCHTDVCACRRLSMQGRCWSIQSSASTSSDEEDMSLIDEGAMRLRCPYHAARLHDIDTSSPPPPSCTMTIIIITMHRRHRHPHHLIQSLSSKSSAVAETLGILQQKQQGCRSELSRREYYFYFASHRKPHFKPDRHRSVTPNKHQCSSSTSSKKKIGATSNNDPHRALTCRIPVRKKGHRTPFLTDIFDTPIIWR